MLRSARSLHFFVMCKHPEGGSPCLTHAGVYVPASRNYTKRGLLPIGGVRFICRSACMRRICTTDLDSAGLHYCDATPTRHSVRKPPPD